MTSLERARHFLGQKASRLAMTVVPLAAAAVATVVAPTPAKAGTVVFSGGNCFVTPTPSGAGNGSCSIIQQTAPGGNLMANWITLTGSGSISGGGALQFGTLSGGFTNSGGISPSDIPVAWDFNITAAPGVTVSYGLDFYVTVLTASNNYISPSFLYNNSVSGGGAVQSSGAITIPSGGSVTAYNMTATFMSSGSFSVSIPTGSIDFNPDPPASAPEPASLLLMLPAGAWLFLRRKKRA